MGTTAAVSEPLPKDVLKDLSEVQFKELQKLLKGTTLDLRSILMIGKGAAEALKLLHEQQVVYKNLNPGTIMVSSDRERVKLKTISSAPPSDLRYISPEQTGRFNRQVDHRTDLYSLGIVFYQMLSGKPPFEAEDFLELVHAHLAKEAQPLNLVQPGIPQVLADIVKKLLQKKQEDRYQSARALQHDLEKCLKLLCPQEPKEGDSGKNSGDRIEPFEIAQLDRPRNFSMSNQLYGREAEMEVLKNAYQGVKEGEHEFITVSGYAGVGKTSLVREFSNYAAEEGGTLATGKFDQYKSNVPYTAFIQAYQPLLREILSESEEVVLYWKEKILAALSPNAQLVVDIIPDLGVIIGSQPPSAGLAPPEAQNRWNAVLLKFIQVFSSQEKPLVLFLDDLQWADLSSIRLVEQLVLDQPPFVMLIGAYRNQEIDARHPLFRLFSQLREADSEPKSIDLKPLSLKDINRFIAHALNRSIKETLPLAKVCRDKTKGNPFFLRQFLEMLKDEGLLSSERAKAAWVWDLPSIMNCRVTDNVIDLMILKINKLSPASIESLTLAACLGSNLDLPTLEIVLENTPEGISGILCEAVESGLIQVKENRYSFLHDRVQQAAYSLLEDESKIAAHYKIAKLLSTKLREKEQEQRLFELADHWNKASSLSLDSEEQCFLLKLNLNAGKKAKATSAYERALDYLATAKKLCRQEAWSTHYPLALELHLELAEMAYVCTQFELVEEIAAETMAHCQDILELGRISEIMIAAYTAQNEFDKAMATSENILGLLGVPFPRRPHLGHVVLEYLRTIWVLRGKSCEDLLNLPLMTNEKSRMALRIFNSTGICSYSASYNATILMVLKALRISLNYGLAEETIVAYSAYGYIINMLFKKADRGYEFGQLAVRLQEKMGVERFDCKIRMMFNMVIRHSKEPLRETLKDFPYIYQRGFAAGDLLSAGHSIMQYFVYSYFSGRRLQEIEQEMQEHQPAMYKTGHETSLRLCQLYRQVAGNFAGLSSDPCTLAGEHFDEIRLLPLFLKSNDRTVVFNIYFHRMLLDYYFYQPGKALQNLPFVEEYLDGVLGTFCLPLVHFYGSLVLAKNYEDLSVRKRYRSKGKIKRSIKVLERLARSAPENILNKLYLLRAELARLNREDHKAAASYDLAIKYAGANKFSQEEALANELAGEFYLSRQREALALYYLREAFNCYQKWGAKAKEEELLRRYPQLLEKLNPYSGAPEFPDIDLASILKIGQAISGEIILEDLLKLLIKIMLQNSGARTVLFILAYDNRLTIEAEGKAEDNTIRLLESLELEAHNPDLPVKLITYAARTGEISTLDSEQQESSVLCLPVIMQGKVLGLFYLENDLAPGIFTQERQSFLQLLSSQIAVSLENAKRYQNLERIIAQHTKELQEKNANKTRFVANVSHEIRTPLQGIMGLTSLLKKSRQYNQDYVNLIQSSAETLLGIINDILDISRMESNRLAIEERVFALRELLSSTVANYEVQAKEKGIKLVLIASPELPEYLLGDPLRISQILNNLLNNALKFTHQGTVELKVSIEARIGGKPEVQFRVNDSGIGIPPTKLRTIFESFTHVDSSISQKYGGTGLGLTIVKRLAELMAGRIEAASQEGEGSSFRCFLPLGIPTQQEIATAQKNMSFEDCEQADLQSLKVIAAEDNLANQMYIKQILAYHNCQATIVNNGLELVQAMKSQDYDCILLDKNMPEMDGLETTKIIRGQEVRTGKHIPIIALTASAMLGEGDKFLRQGVDYYLTKPIREKELIGILKQISLYGRTAVKKIEAEKQDSINYAADVKEEQLIDKEVFWQEAKYFGREVMLLSITDFLENHRIWIDTIKTDLEAQDPVKLEKSAHRLASALSSLYAMKVLELARELERDARMKDRCRSQAQLDAILEVLPGLLRELQELRE